MRVIGTFAFSVAWGNVGVLCGLSGSGRTTEFAEPAFAYTHTALKGNPKWQRVIVLGKTESQDTYMVFTGAAVMLTCSVRRIATAGKCHLGFYLHFNAATWKFKAGFGGRVLPTKRAVEGQTASFQVPEQVVLPSPFHDKDAEDVKRKMIEEKAEERETMSMSQHDRARPSVSLTLSSQRFCMMDRCQWNRQLMLKWLCI
eukprot:s2013_g17.t1